MRVKPRRNEYNLHRTSNLTAIIRRSDIECLIERDMRWEGSDDRPHGSGEVRRREDLDAVFGRVGACGGLLLEEGALVAVVVEVGVAGGKEVSISRRFEREKAAVRYKSEELTFLQPSHLHCTPPRDYFPKPVPPRWAITSLRYDTASESGYSAVS